MMRSMRNICSLFLVYISLLQPASGFVPASSADGKLVVTVTPNLVVFRKNCVRSPARRRFMTLPQFSTPQEEEDEEDYDQLDEKARQQTALLNSGVGGIVLAGGIAGFVSKGSKASLMAGSTFGGLMLLSAFLVFKKNDFGYRLAGAASGLLTFVMGKKYFASGKYMPAGFIATLAVIAFVYNSVDTMVAGTKKDEDSKEE